MPCLRLRPRPRLIMFRARAQNYTSAADIFSLGAVLYFLAEWRHPVAPGGEPIGRYLRSHASVDLSFHDAHRAIRPMILSMMSVAPAARPTADDVCDQAEALSYEIAFALSHETRDHEKMVFGLVGAIGAALLAALLAPLFLGKK